MMEERIVEFGDSRMWDSLYATFQARDRLAREYEHRQQVDGIAYGLLGPVSAEELAR